VTLKMPAFEWVHVQLHQQKGMISLSPPTICNSAFNINWSEITTEHVLTLLCCFAAEYNNVVSADYIRTMTDTVTKQDNEYSPYEPFVNMIKAFYRMELTKVPQGKLTGKDNIF
ncbi:hypothetical protein ACRW2I_19710, partial [Escherichia coli]